MANFVSIDRLNTFLTKLKTFISNNYVPTYRRVNGNQLTGDIILDAADVEALPLAGGTLTGDLTVGSASMQTNGYVNSTMLKTTSATNLNTKSSKVAVLDGSGYVYYRTPAEILSDAGGGAGAETVTYTATTSTSWTTVSDYYTQNITVTGLLASDNPIVSIVPTIDGHEDEWSAWSSVFKLTTSANTLTLYSDEAISMALSLQIKVVR